LSKSKRGVASSVHDGAAYKHYDYSDDEEASPLSSDDEDQKKPSDGDKDKDKEKDKVPARQKSATLSFWCDSDSIGGVAAVSFVATDPDECSYMFEIRSQHACARAEPHKPGSVGPGSVFAIIFLIAVLVYFGGGVFYQRTVAHARGWRQLPNYSLWAGIWSFIRVSLDIPSAAVSLAFEKC
jgi:cation-dependent mannose-6-phosphate receptor